MARYSSEVILLFAVPGGTEEGEIRKALPGIKKLRGVKEVDLLNFSPTPSNRWQLVIVEAGREAVKLGREVKGQLQQYVPEVSDVKVYFGRYREIEID